MKGVNFAMELIRISESKLKIMLTPTDMYHFDLKNEDFGDDSQKMRHAFKNLLREVKRQIDFDADDERLSVQYFPSREGGCEMFLTQLPSHIRSEKGKKERQSETERPNERASLAVKECSFHLDKAYRMETLRELLAACQRLVKSPYISQSTVFKDERSRYFLILSIFSPSPFSIPDALCFLSEYGTLQGVREVTLYIREHGSVICEKNAVQTLAALV